MWLLKLHFAFSILCMMTFFLSYDVFERCFKMEWICRLD